MAISQDKVFKNLSNKDINGREYIYINVSNQLKTIPKASL